MICPNCNTKNSYYHRYCYYCGNKLGSDSNAFIDNTVKYEIVKDSTEDGFEQNNDLVNSTNAEDKTIVHTKYFSETIEEPVKSGISDIENEIHTELYDDFFDESDDKVDLIEQLPLRRYKKEKNSGDISWLVKLCALIIVLSLLSFGIMIVVSNFNKNRDLDASSNEITASISVIPTPLDGIPAHKIIVETDIGVEVTAAGQTVAVKDGKAEIIIDDIYLSSLVSNTSGNNLEAQVGVTLSKSGCKDKEETVTISLQKPHAPLTILQPSEEEVVVEETQYTLILLVTPGSQLIIDGEDCSDFIDEHGRIEKKLNVPDQPETPITIEVATTGCQDTVREIILRKPIQEITLKIDQSIPIKSNSEWTKITGTTHPAASLEVSLPTQSPPVIDPQTGNFTVHVKTGNQGYTPCVLTATMEGKAPSTVEVILDREVDQSYTNSAWKIDYSNMVKIPNIHNGHSFAFSGTIDEIIYTGDKSIFTVNIASDSNTPQLLFVEFWGSFEYTPGDRIKVFGDRWGNREGKIRILAKFIYPI